MTFIFLSLDSLFSMMIPVASFSAHDRIGFMIAFFFKIIFTPLKNFISCFSISEKKNSNIKKKKVGVCREVSLHFCAELYKSSPIIKLVVS